MVAVSMISVIALARSPLAPYPWQADVLCSRGALGYWSQRRIDDYLHDAHVRFIADDPPTIDRAQRFTRSPLPLEVRHTFPLRGWPTGTRVLVAVISR